MADETPSQSEFLLYQTEDGRTRIQYRLEDETIWLTQLQLAELFQTTVPNINLHLKAIYAEGELTTAATIKRHLIVGTDPARLEDSARRLPPIQRPRRASQCRSREPR